MAENENNAQRIGEKNASRVRETAEKFVATTEQTAKTVENAGASTAKGIHEFSFKAIEFARANSEAAFDCATQSMSAKAPSDVLELWMTHGRKQFETLIGQSTELAILSQRITAEAADILSSGRVKIMNQA